MNKEFVTYEIAEDFKKLGYDEPSLAYYTKATERLCRTGTSETTVDFVTVQTIDLYNDYCLAPLVQQAFDWLREKHKFMYLIADVEVSASNTVGYRFRYQAWKLMNDEIWIEDKSLLGYYSYNEAREECLKAIIKHIQDEKIQS